MTVKELIKQLQEMDQTSEVICMDEYEDDYEVVDTFSYTSNSVNQTIICITKD